MAITKVTSGLISADASSVDLNIDAGTLYIDATNNRVGIGTTSPTTALDVTGTATMDGLTVVKGSVGTVGSFSGDNVSGGRALEIIASTTTNVGDTHTLNAKSTTGILKLATSGNTARMGVFSTGIGFYEDTGTTLKFFWDASAESLGIGTTSPVAPVTINDKATFSFNVNDAVYGNNLYYDGAGNDRWERLSGNAGGAYYQTGGMHVFYRTTAGGATGDAVTPSESMRIDASGRLLLGATSSLAPAGTILPLGYRGRAGTGGTETNNFNIAWTGSVANLWIDTSNLGAISTSSDYRIKRNVETQTDNALSKVMKIRPVTYQMNNYKELFKVEDGDEIKEGFIAHELAEIIPSAVMGKKDDPNQIQSLKLDALVSVLTKAIQEQQALIEAQATTITDLTTRIEILENA